MAWHNPRLQVSFVLAHVRNIVEPLKLSIVDRLWHNPIKIMLRYSSLLRNPLAAGFSLRRQYQCHVISQWNSTMCLLVNRTLRRHHCRIKTMLRVIAQFVVRCRQTYCFCRHNRDDRQAFVHEIVYRWRRRVINFACRTVSCTSTGCKRSGIIHFNAIFSEKNNFKKKNAVSTAKRAYNAEDRVTYLFNFSAIAFVSSWGLTLI